jgi:hypothetical protein
MSLSALVRRTSVGPFVLAATTFIVAILIWVPTTHAQPPCDRGPDALTEAFAKLDITDEPQIVDHTCIESTGYPGERCFYTYVPECADIESPLV